MTPQTAPVAQAATTAASAAAPVHSAVLDAAISTGQRQRSGRSAVPATYTVRRGDSLSSIAGHLYHDRAAWPVLYWRNHHKIRWANDIYAGQVLHVPAKPARIPKAPSALEPAPRPAAAPAQAAAGAIPHTAYAGAVPGGSFGACVVARESGGNAQVMNATGHYGLYQFSESTWVAYGGSAADFGHASVAEQNQVFANALAAGGESNWAPYDGC